MSETTSSSGGDRNEGHDRGGAPVDAGAEPVTASGRRAARAAEDAGPEAEDATSDPTAARRRPPLWLLVGLGALVVVLAVVAVVVLGNRGEEQDVPVAATVTLPVPTPTIEPVAREAGTAFFDALPSVVLSYALTETGEHEPLLADGALEAYRLVYSDGGDVELTVHAGQWRDAAGAQAVFDRVAAAQAEGAQGTEDAEGTAEEVPAEETAAAAAEDATPGVDQGAVEIDGTEVGRYLIVPDADGGATAWWTNGTVLVQVEGPAQAVRDLYAAFPL